MRVVACIAMLVLSWPVASSSGEDLEPGLASPVASTSGEDLESLKPRARVEALFNDWNSFTSFSVGFDLEKANTFLRKHVDRFYADDVIDQVGDLPSYSGVSLQGKDFVFKGMMDFLKAVPDMQMFLKNVVHQGKTTFVEYAIFGHESGRLVAMDSSVVYTYNEKGLIAHQKYYFDEHNFKEKTGQIPREQPVAAPEANVVKMFKVWNEFSSSRVTFDKYECISFLTRFYDRFYANTAAELVLGIPDSESLRRQGKEELIDGMLEILQTVPNLQRVIPPTGLAAASASDTMRRVFVEVDLSGNLGGNPWKSHVGTIYTFDSWGKIIHEKTYIDLHGFQALQRDAQVFTTPLQLREDL